MKKRPFPPGPKSDLLGKNYLAMHADPLHFLLNEVPKYGDIVHMQLGRRHDFLFNHPDQIKEILLNQECLTRSTPRAAKRLLNDGLLTRRKFDSRQRQMLRPAFQPQKIEYYGKIMAEYAGQFIEQWTDAREVNIEKEMMDLTMNIIVKTLLGSDIEEEKHEISEALRVIQELTSRKTNPFFDRLLWNLPLQRTLRFEKAKARLDRTILALIEKRRKQKTEEPSLISMLLEIQYNEDGSQNLSDAQIRDEAMTMFYAGHETTAAALTWAWYLLSTHPDVEAKLHAELQTVLGENPPTMKDLPKLTYTRKILAETMRLYPPVWLIARRPIEDYEIAGYVVPKNSYINLSQFLVHRDPRYYPDPERFDPERWAPGEVAKRPKFAYFPFGGGSRLCVGEGFAWTEGILVIAAIAQKWRLQFAGNHPVHLEPLITLRPRNGMPMVLKKRNPKETECRDNSMIESR